MIFGPTRRRGTRALLTEVRVRNRLGAELSAAFLPLWSIGIGPTTAKKRASALAANPRWAPNRRAPTEMKVAPAPEDAPERPSASIGVAYSTAASGGGDAKPNLPTWGYLVVLLAVALPTACCTLTFSIMGYGEYIYVELVDLQRRLNLFTFVSGLALLIIALLYVLDASYWTGIGVIVRRLLVSVVGAALGLACLVGTKNYPWAPLLFSMLVRCASAQCQKQNRKTTRSNNHTRVAAVLAGGACLRRTRSQDVPLRLLRLDVLPRAEPRPATGCASDGEPLRCVGGRRVDAADSLRARLAERLGQPMGRQGQALLALAPQLRGDPRL